MKKLTLVVQLMDDDGTPAAGLKLTAQRYSLARSQWLNLATGTTDTKGLLAKTINLSMRENLDAPCIRLVESGRPAPRVLAQQARYSYSTANKELTVDFGDIERLGDTAYELRAVQRQLGGGHQVAGQPKRAAIAAAVLMRHVVSPGFATTARVPSAATVARTPNSAGAQPTEATLRGAALDVYNAELIRHVSIESQLKTQLDDKTATVRVQQGELDSQRREVSKLRTDLSVARAQSTTLQADLERLRSNSQRRVALDTIASNIGTGVANANNRLKTDKQPYRLGRIEVNLKGEVSDDGSAMSLLNVVDLEKLKGLASVPGLTMELIPDNDSTSVPGDVSVPELAGLTESASRRLLYQRGLTLEPMSRAVALGDAQIVGQALQQSPAAGAKVARGTRVIVVFAVDAEATGGTT